MNVINNGVCIESMLSTKHRRLQVRLPGGQTRYRFPTRRGHLFQWPPRNMRYSRDLPVFCCFRNTIRSMAVVAYYLRRNPLRCCCTDCLMIPHSHHRLALLLPPAPWRLEALPVGLGERQKGRSQEARQKYGYSWCLLRLVYRLRQSQMRRKKCNPIIVWIR